MTRGLTERTRTITEVDARTIIEFDDRCIAVDAREWEKQNRFIRLLGEELLKQVPLLDSETKDLASNKKYIVSLHPTLARVLVAYVQEFHLQEAERALAGEDAT